MTSKFKNRSLTEAAALASVDSTVAAFIHDLQIQEGISDKEVIRSRPIARHFLIWLSLNGIPLESVDAMVIYRFLQHDCECRGRVPATYMLHPWSKRRSSPPLMKFVRYLEREGRIETPGELEGNLRLLDEYIEGMQSEGYGSRSLIAHRSGCAGLIAWLHFARVRLCDLTLDVYARFLNRKFICSIPGVFYGMRIRSSEGFGYEREVRRFLDHLVSLGLIAPLHPAPDQEVLPEILVRFSKWLERHRGLRPKSIREHIRLVSTILPDLGEEPGTYDIALIRRLLFEQIELRSVSSYKRLTTAMRMYLRFLASEGHISPVLFEATPTMIQWRLSVLPRHIPPEDVERAIATCGDDPVGVRNRAILLLLARLAFRAGDVTSLRLGDIDWEKAEIRVAGKSRRQTALPLPQDVGDALHAYIATARPRVDNEMVFFCYNAPCRPLRDSYSVSMVARSALDRAGIVTQANRGRGAHVFRHSRATELLRSGATLEVIQALLRHERSKSTMIYAKTDKAMLLEIAQPWIGGTKG